MGYGENQTYKVWGHLPRPADDAGAWSTRDALRSRKIDPDGRRVETTTKSLLCTEVGTAGLSCAPCPSECSAHRYRGLAPVPSVESPLSTMNRSRRYPHAPIRPSRPVGGLLARLRGGSDAGCYSGSITRGLPRPLALLLGPENLLALLEGVTCPPRDGSDLLVSETGPVLISLHLSGIADTQADVRLATCIGRQRQGCRGSYGHQ